MDQVNQLIQVIKTKISPAKLEDGGAAILKILNKNHHRANIGIIDNPPRTKRILRLDKREYIKPTNEKSPEEHNPWAIIIIIAPLQPK